MPLAALMERNDLERPRQLDGTPAPRASTVPAPSPTIAADARATLLVAGAMPQTAELARWGDPAGLRCIGQVALEDVARRLDQLVSVDLILVDLRGAGAQDALDGAAARALAARPTLTGTRLAVLTDLAGLDCAMARLASPDTDILCDPRSEDIASLLALAALRTRRTDHQPTLHDATRETESARLERLSDEVSRLAATIDRLTRSNGTISSNGNSNGNAVADGRIGYRVNGHGVANGGERGKMIGFAAPPPPAFGERGPARESPMPASEDGDEPISHGEIRALLRARRMREQFLAADLFADPAWDMILDLMAARLAGQRVSVSSLCIAAAVPPTTALRWIGQLTERGVFSRIDDPADGRRVFIALTDSAAQAVNDWARAVRRNGGLLS